MPAGIDNPLIEQGSSWSSGLVYKVNGVAQDITGFIIKCQIKTRAGGDIVATPTCSIADALLGKINLELTKEQTWLIPAYGRNYKELTEYVYDVLLTSADGVAIRLLNGIISISPGVTMP